MIGRSIRLQVSLQAQGSKYFSCKPIMILQCDPSNNKDYDNGFGVHFSSYHT